MKKRRLSAVLAAVMAVSMFPSAAFAAVKVDNTYQPGTYTADAVGYTGEDGKGKVTVTVTLDKNDKDKVVISNIEADGSSQTPAYWKKALPILDSIKKQNGTEGVNTISGATKSSKAVLNATDKALKQAAAGFTGGTGTQDDPYLISSENGLRYLQEQVAGGTTYAGQYIKLDADVALSKEWTPIGTKAQAFGGSFDGGNHTVSGMTITDSTLSYAGLFGYVLNGTVIKNIKLTDISIDIPNAAQSVYIGGVVGFIENNSKTEASSVIDNCLVSGKINVKTANQIAMVGGLAGCTDQRAAVTNCGADVEVSADSGSKNGTVGGLIGNASMKNLYVNDYSLGNVTLTTTNTKYDYAGAMFGQVNGILYNCYTSGTAAVNCDNPKTPAAAFAGRLGTAYADSCYYVGEPVFGAQSGSINDKTVVQKTAEELKSEDFAQLLHNNLSANAIKTMTDNTAAAKVADCTDFGALTARVNDKFQDWAVSDGIVKLTGRLWSSSEIDAGIFDSGDGTQEQPYIIKTEQQLRDFAKSLNDKIDYTNKYVALGGNIKLSNEAWYPVGGSDYLFNGTFDGKGYTVSGMTLGTKDAPYALNKDFIYVGMFGVLGEKSVVKNVHLTDIAFYTSYEVTGYVGGLVGAMQGSEKNGDYTGAVIDGCSVSGELSLISQKGNQYVGGIVGMQYKGAVINCISKIHASSVVTSEAIAEAGGLVGINNRGLVANCWTDANIYGSGSRENGNEGMAAVSNLIACNAGALVNCIASGDVTTKEHSTYAGMVTGWVTGIGKSYSCWYDLDSEMLVGKDTDNPLHVKPVESIGTKVSSGVNDEGDAYTGGLVDSMNGYDAAGYAAVADAMNKTFAAFPIDITVYGLSNNALKSWSYDSNAKLVTFGADNANVTYVQPDCEKVVKPEAKLLDGTWYGRDDDKTSVVAITVADDNITETKVLSGQESGAGYDAAVEKAKYKATYGDFSHYEAADVSRFAGGSGTAEDPYQIATAQQLRYLSYSINADVNWSGVYFKQTADISLAGEDWQPIGWALVGDVNGQKKSICSYPFRGNYDGGNYTVSGLTIGSEKAPVDQMTSGLFGLASGSYQNNEAPAADAQTVTLKNIHLTDISIHTAVRYETYAGGLVGSAQNGVYMDNCSVTGVIDTTTSESFARAGGLASSIMRGASTNCWTNVTIHAETDTNHVYAGGLYGMDNRATTINCYTLGNVTGNSTNNNKVHIGGLVGQAGGVHVNCYAAGDVVSNKTTTDVGILNGRSAGITAEYNCYYNTESVLKQGDTTISPAVGVGVVVTDASNVEGKTKTELASEDFAALLSSNVSEENLAAVLAEVNKTLAAQNDRGFTQQNYYQNNALSVWTVKDGIVTFGAADKPVDPKPTKTPFTDVSENDWFYNDVNYVYSKGMMNGMSETEFAPDYTTTRGMLVTMLYRLEGEPAVSGASGFADVSSDRYYANAVAWAAANGIVNGYSSTQFAPEDAITREQMAVILHRYAAYKGYDVSARADLSGFADSGKINSWAADAMSWANAAGLINGMGDNTLNPTGNALRSQIAALLHRFCENVK